jgi:hypothetical protein
MWYLGTFPRRVPQHPVGCKTPQPALVGQTANTHSPARLACLIRVRQQEVQLKSNKKGCISSAVEYHLRSCLEPQKNMKKRKRPRFFFFLRRGLAMWPKWPQTHDPLASASQVLGSVRFLQPLNSERSYPPSLNPDPQAISSTGMMMAKHYTDTYKW